MKPVVTMGIQLGLLLLLLSGTNVQGAALAAPAAAAAVADTPAQTATIPAAPAADGVATNPGAGLAAAPAMPAGATPLASAGPAAPGMAAPGMAVPGAAAMGAAGAIPEPPPGPCDMRLTFFPPRGDNLPTGWTQAVQQAAGNMAPDQMVRISLAGYPIPQLYMAPISVFTSVGGAVPVGCITGQNAAGAGALVRPAAFTVAWSLAGKSGQIGPFLKGSKQDPPANVTLNSVPTLPDGDYCMQIRMDLIPGSGAVSVGAQQFEVPARPQSVTRQVCFIKLSSRPTANITFHSCNSSFAVDLTGITPPPVFARPDLQLTSTVFHVWGKLNRTFDAGPQPEGLTDYFGQYVKWADPTQPNFLQVFLESPGLINGYYDIWVEGSLATPVPDLNSLFGLDQYDDGSAKFMGNSLRNSSNRPVPIQTVRSKIANLGGPDAATPPGAATTFTWNTEGYGEQFCYVDGARIANSADLVHCESPLNLKVADGGNHTLEVVLLDVCGQTTTNGIFFGAWGWRPNPKWLPPAPPVEGFNPEATAGLPTPLPLRPMARFNRTRAASGAASAGRLQAAAAALLAGAAALLAL